MATADVQRRLLRTGQGVLNPAEGLAALRWVLRANSLDMKPQVAKLQSCFYPTCHRAVASSQSQPDAAHTCGTVVMLCQYRPLQLLHNQMPSQSSRRAARAKM